MDVSMQLISLNVKTHDCVHVLQMATSLHTTLQKRHREDEHTSILSLMHDPQRTARYQRLEEKLAILKKASQELMHI